MPMEDYDLTHTSVAMNMSPTNRKEMGEHSVGSQVTVEGGLTECGIA